VAVKACGVIAGYERKLAECRAYAEAHGEDPPEITGWTWTAG
jgi:phosphoketolase